MTSWQPSRERRRAFLTSPRADEELAFEDFRQLLP
jgi:hypothetical protein